MTVASALPVPFLARLFPELTPFPALLDELHRACQRHPLKPGQVLVEPGSHCDSVFFIEKGMVRAYYYNDNDNDNDNDDGSVTSWFAVEEGICYFPHSYYYREPTSGGLTSIEKGLAWSVTKSTLIRLVEHHPRLAVIMEKVSKYYLVEQEQHLKLLRLIRASDRLACFRGLYPKVYGRVLTKHLATYLSMTPQTLCRLKKEA